MRAEEARQGFSYVKVHVQVPVRVHVQVQVRVRVSVRVHVHVHVRVSAYVHAYVYGLYLHRNALGGLQGCSAPASTLTPTLKLYRTQSPGCMAKYSIL